GCSELGARQSCGIFSHPRSGGVRRSNHSQSLHPGQRECAQESHRSRKNCPITSEQHVSPSGLGGRMRGTALCRGRSPLRRRLPCSLHPLQSKNRCKPVLGAQLSLLSLAELGHQALAFCSSHTPGAALHMGGPHHAPCLPSKTSV